VKTLLFPDNPGYVYGLDLLGSGSEEDMQLYMKYFADEASRAEWKADFPELEMPPREDTPFDRDKDLPKSAFG